MASLVFEKLRSALRRPVMADVPATLPPARPADATTKPAGELAAIAVEVDRLAAAHRAVEARLDALEDQHELIGDALRDADGSRTASANELRQAIARLQARLGTLGHDREKFDAAIDRLDEAHGVLRAAQNRSEQRLDEITAARRDEAAAQATLLASVREARDAAALSAERLADGLATDEQVRALASRIVIAHLISFVALVAVLATMAYIVWKG